MSAEVEVILSVAGEGGGYTILGRCDERGIWEFRADGYDWTPQLLGEDAHEREGNWVPTLEIALGQINRAWPRLRPRKVHPTFRTAVLTEVFRVINADGEIDLYEERTFRRWQQICGVDESADLDDDR